MDQRVTIGYTVYNKKYLIPAIVDGVKDILNSGDELIMVFDGCTDNSFEVFQKLKNQLNCQVTIQVFNEDQFEVRSNNWILKNALYDTVILFQDDIINKDQFLRQKVFDILEEYGDHAGLLGGRSGFELSGYPDWPELPLNKISNWEHKENQYEMRLTPGDYARRTFLNRGPLVFTHSLLADVGLLSDSYYPLWGDDLDYCARTKFVHHRENIVFQCDVISKLEWGATHKKGQSKIKSGAFKTNYFRFIDQWGGIIKRYNHENSTIV